MYYIMWNIGSVDVYKHMHVFYYYAYIHVCDWCIYQKEGRIRCARGWVRMGVEGHVLILSNMLSLDDVYKHIGNVHRVVFL